MQSVKNWLCPWFASWSTTGKFWRQSVTPGKQTAPPTRAEMGATTSMEVPGFAMGEISEPQSGWKKRPDTLSWSCAYAWRTHGFYLAPTWIGAQRVETGRLLQVAAGVVTKSCLGPRWSLFSRGQSLHLWPLTCVNMNHQSPTGRSKGK